MPAAVFSKATAMTSAPSSTGGILATRVKFSGELASDASFIYADDGAGHDLEVAFSPSVDVNKFFLFFLTPIIDSVEYEYIVTSDPTEFVPDTWYSVLIKFYTDSGDAGYPVEVWINGVEVTMDVVAWDGTAKIVDWSIFDSWQIGNIYGTEIVDSKFIWFEPSLTSNPSYSDFFDGDNCVKNLGTDGSTPTGSQPMIYMTGGAADYSVNKGYGGAFSGTSGAISTGTYTCP